VAALYYADRINQLPLGIIGIAAGTVILPQMSRLLAAGQVDEAHAAQRRTIFLTWLLAAPFLAGFLAVPDLIMRALFMRGAFTAGDAEAASSALLAYGAGLPAVVLIRSAVASFYARGDTATPLWASLTGIAVNIGLKVVLMGPLQQAGLALATSLGAWVNLGLLTVLASRRGFMHLDRRLYAMLACVALATVTAGLAMYAAATALVPLLAGLSHIGDIIGLALVGIVGAAFYGATVYCAFGTAGMDLKSALRR